MLSVTLPARLRRPTPAAGPLLPATRAGVGVLLVLGFANAVFLYPFPGQAATGYAWKLKPPIAAQFLGAGYVAGTVATALIFFGVRRWRSAQPIAFSLVVLSVLLIVATVIHGDRFRFDYPPTWGWVIVYSLAPFLVPVAMIRQRRVTDVPPFDPRLRTLRTISLIAGAVLMVGALALYLSPTGLGSHWPWPLTPLVARATAAWCALTATILLWSAADVRQPTEAFIPYVTIGVWSAASLAVPALHPDGVTHTGAPLIVYLAGMAVVLAIAVYGIARSERAPL